MRNAVSSGDHSLHAGRQWPAVVHQLTVGQREVGRRRGRRRGSAFPVGQREYDRTIEYLERAVKQARLGERERLDALQRLAVWTDEQARPSPAPPSAAPLPLSAAPGPSRPVQLGLGAEFFKS